MSAIIRNFKPYTLQKRTKKQNKSGQWVYDWEDVKTIDIAIYPANYTILTSANQKYAESTNTGLTPEKDIKAEINRIYVNDNEVYEITFSNPIGKFTQLYLKQVIFNG
ncbi:phage head completion protein [Clostridium thermosuccinogenes]|uniref:phage head completion protein n=1 Tax=Clostridium thermosuccinogenes TaxID=84032 RepID=UPI000CCC390C|nr:head-tail adaptor protein [Pseudoclostridium thermosuccinogenes]PNT94151.1 hypothetical protein CDQ83_11930 [Pseudoclostridium thermosuccinogenes]